MQRISREESRALTTISQQGHIIGMAKDIWEAEKRLIELEEGGHIESDDSEDSLASTHSSDLIGK